MKNRTFIRGSNHLDTYLIPLEGGPKCATGVSSVRLVTVERERHCREREAAYTKVILAKYVSRIRGSWGQVRGALDVAAVRDRHRP